MIKSKALISMSTIFNPLSNSKKWVIENSISRDEFNFAACPIFALFAWI